MKFEIIEPAPRKTSNAERRRALARKAHQCACWCKASGFEVLAVMGGLRQPRVVIKPSPLCDELEGAVAAYERGVCGARRYRYAVRFGCMVEWATHGGAA